MKVKVKKVPGSDYTMYAGGGGIHINPANKGKFNATKKRTGKTTEELTHSKNPLTRKRAVFAQNAAKWRHPGGGYTGDMVPIEAEGGEMIQYPGGALGEIQGPSHEDGGTNMVVPEGSRIYSKRIKIDGKTMAQRKESRDRKMNRLGKILMEDPTNQLSRNTGRRVAAQVMQEEQMDMKIMETANPMMQGIGGRKTPQASGGILAGADDAISDSANPPDGGFSWGSVPWGAIGTGLAAITTQLAQGKADTVPNPLFAQTAHLRPYAYGGRLRKGYAGGGEPLGPYEELLYDPRTPFLDYGYNSASDPNVLPFGGQRFDYSPDIYGTGTSMDDMVKAYKESPLVKDVSTYTTGNTGNTYENFNPNRYNYPERIAGMNSGASAVFGNNTQEPLDPYATQESQPWLAYKMQTISDRGPAPGGATYLNEQASYPLAPGEIPSFANVLAGRLGNPYVSPWESMDTPADVTAARARMLAKPESEIFRFDKNPLPVDKPTEYWTNRDLMYGKGRGPGTPPAEDEVVYNPNRVTMGDIAGYAGAALGTIGPLMATIKNRKGDKPNINPFRNFGKAALEANELQQEQAARAAAASRYNARIAANTAKAGTRRSAQSVNTMRALDTITDLQNNAANLGIDSAQATQMMNLLAARAGLLNQRDQMVMQGEQYRDAADRKDRDQYYSQLARNLADAGTSIQTLGKDLNQAQLGRETVGMLSDLSAHGLGYKRVNGKYQIVKLKDADKTYTPVNTGSPD